MALNRSLVGVVTLATALGLAGSAAAQEGLSAEAQRGQMLVQELECAECHSPMGDPMAFSGGESDGWHGPALDGSWPNPVKWTQNDLVDYLFDGFHENHGVAGGPMTKTVDTLYDRSEDDAFAIAAYIVSLMGGEPTDEAASTAAREQAAALEWGSPTQPAAPTDPMLAEGHRVYEQRCTTCHKAGGLPTPLALTAAMLSPHAGNAVFAIQHGIKPPRGALDRGMPAQGLNLSDPEFVAVVNYIRDRFTDLPAWTDVETLVTSARGGAGIPMP